MKEELWIGLVRVKPLPRIPEALGGAAGAYVNIVTWASDPKTYRAKAETVAATYDVYVVEIEDAEPVAIRKSRFRVNDEIEDLISRADLTGTLSCAEPFMSTHMKMPKFKTAHYQNSN